MDIQTLQRIAAHHAQMRDEAGRLEQALWMGLQDAPLDKDAGTFRIRLSPGEHSGPDTRIEGAAFINEYFLGGRTLRWQQRTEQRVRTGEVSTEFLVTLRTRARTLVSLRRCATTTVGAIEEGFPADPHPWTFAVHQTEGANPFCYAELSALVPTNFEEEQRRRADHLRLELARPLPANGGGLAVTTDEALICARTLVEAFKRGPLS